jgi:hypothetical protein
MCFSFFVFLRFVDTWACHLVNALLECLSCGICNLDLNLIYPLDALLEECHVTRAAKRSFLSQSAMSGVLERLCDMFGDPLLVRNGRGYERTVPGERVLRELESLMPWQPGITNQVLCL